MCWAVEPLSFPSASIWESCLRGIAHMSKYNDKQFEAHIDIGMQIDRFLLVFISSFVPCEFQYYSICTQAEAALREKKFLLFMRNVFLNYWHCVRLQVEEIGKRALERIPSTLELNCCISSSFLRKSFQCCSVKKRSTFEREVSRCNWIILLPIHSVQLTLSTKSRFFSERSCVAFSFIFGCKFRSALII